MSIDVPLNFAAALLCAVLALVAMFRPKLSATQWLFGGGMLTFALESTLAGISLQAARPEEVLHWQQLELLARAAQPVVWLAFSLTYSRGNYREFLSRWRYLLLGAALVPAALAIQVQHELSRFLPVSPGHEWQLPFGAAGYAFNIVVLIVTALILANFEKTFRSAVGTLRWRIKFVILGLCVIFGTSIYLASQALISSNINLLLSPVWAVALLIGGSLIILSQIRSGRIEVDVYPSHSFLYGSLTVLLVGIYLFSVGVLSHIIGALGGDANLPLQAFLMLLGVVGLALLLLSNKLRQKTQHFISRHFKRPLYDYRKIWTLFTEKTVHTTSQPALCTATARLLSDTFNILSVTIWLADEKGEHLSLAASTSLRELPATSPAPTTDGVKKLLAAIQANPEPFDLDTTRADWAEGLRLCNPGTFLKGGHRVCVPVVAAERALGVIILADRVGGVPFSLEELDLFRCVGSHVGASLLSLQLSEKFVQAREQEAFRAVSAFFAHDLKNAASTLSLMLRNLPQHFDDPAFRADVQRGIAKTVGHMNHLISRLSVLRQKLEIRPVSSDLNEVVNGALSRWEGAAGIELTKSMEPLPRLLLDSEQMQNVVTNLLLNAREALGTQGRIKVETNRHNGWARLIVSDNGCGMAPEFLRHSLFRPFQTTKKNGTGIGMFQCKAVVEAHHGRIEVESELGKGTCFRILLPLPQA